MASNPLPVGWTVRALVQWFQANTTLLLHALSVIVFLGFIAVVYWRAKRAYRNADLLPNDKSNSKRQAQIVTAWTTLFYRLVGAIIDYLIKLADFVKNLFYFPIG